MHIQTHTSTHIYTRTRTHTHAHTHAHAHAHTQTHTHRSPQALGTQVASLAKELSLSPKEVALLLAVVPPILNVSQPTIIKDR